MNIMTREQFEKLKSLLSTNPRIFDIKPNSDFDGFDLYLSTSDGDEKNDIVLRFTTEVGMDSHHEPVPELNVTRLVKTVRIIEETVEEEL